MVNDELTRLKLRCERLDLLYQVSNVIHSTLDSQEALQLIVSEVVRVTHATSGSLALINPTTGFLEIHAAQNLSSSARKLKLRVGEGITGGVAQTGKPALVGDVTYGYRRSPATSHQSPFSVARPLLHAYKLAFTHPRTGKQMEFVAPIPEDMTGYE